MSATISRPRAARQPIGPALRARMEAAVERLLAALDAIDGDPDLESYLTGTGDDREGEDEETEGDDDADEEPSLGGADFLMDQTLWSAGADDDRELDLDLEEDDPLDHGEHSYDAEACPSLRLGGASHSTQPPSQARLVLEAVGILSRPAESVGEAS